MSVGKFQFSVCLHISFSLCPCFRLFLCLLLCPNFRPPEQVKLAPSGDVGAEYTRAASMLRSPAGSIYWTDNGVGCKDQVVCRRGLPTGSCALLDLRFLLKAVALGSCKELAELYWWNHLPGYPLSLGRLKMNIWALLLSVLEWRKTPVESRDTRGVS